MLLLHGAGKGGTDMRDYRFKAKKLVDRTWAEGYFYKVGWKRDKWEMFTYVDLDDGVVTFVIDPATICEHTGIGDIWEHDIFEYLGELLEVVFIDGAFRCMNGDKSFGTLHNALTYDVIRKIGNKFDGGVE